MGEKYHLLVILSDWLRLNDALINDLIEPVLGLDQCVSISHPEVLKSRSSHAAIEAKTVA